MIDADALRLPLPLPQSTPCGPKLSREVIYTPHLGEFRRISGTEINAAADPLCERATAAMEYIRKINAENEGLSAVILQKGSVDVISDGESVRFNKTGTPAMTKGGTGDLLAGVCGALLCRMPAYDAAGAAAYLLGKCGEMVAEKYGDGLLASDLFPVIAQTLYSDT